MAISLDVIDKFVTTNIDFWTLRPRKFLESVKNNPSRYLSPPRFLLVCLSIISALYFISLSFYKDLSADTLKRFPTLEIKSDPKIVAGRQIVILILIIVVQSLLIKGASWWPLKGKASLKHIMYYQFYTLSISLLFPALDVGLTPFILNSIDSTKSIESANLLNVLPVINLVSSYVLSLIYFFPGYAKLNEVSTWDMYVAMFVFMTFVIGFGFLSVVFSFIVHQTLTFYIL